MSEGFWGPFITLVVGVFVFAWPLVRGFRTGRMEWGNYGVGLSGRRRDQPVRFWLMAFFLGWMAFLCMVVFLGMIFGPGFR